MLLYLLLHSLFFSGESESCTSDWNLNHGLLIINKITHLVARLTEAWVLCVSAKKKFSKNHSECQEVYLLILDAGRDAGG